MVAKTDATSVPINRRSNEDVVGPPWWLGGRASSCQRGWHGHDPWSGRIPRATEQPGSRAAGNKLGPGAAALQRERPPCFLSSSTAPAQPETERNGQRKAVKERKKRVVRIQWNMTQHQTNEVLASVTRLALRVYYEKWSKSDRERQILRGSGKNKAVP